SQETVRSRGRVALAECPEGRGARAATERLFFSAHPEPVEGGPDRPPVGRMQRRDWLEIRPRRARATPGPRGLDKRLDETRGALRLAQGERKKKRVRESIPPPFTPAADPVRDARAPGRCPRRSRRPLRD